MNVDALRTMGAIESIITNLQTNNIDISCIQETHNNRNDRIERGNYSIFFSGEDRKERTTNKPIRGGCAVIIKTLWKTI